MTREETAALCRIVRALCPAQAWDEYTPDAWHEVLGGLDFDECRIAVAAAAARRPFIAPADIITEVAEQRSHDAPHSGACRSRDHDACAWTWCGCPCHPTTVRAIARQARPALPSTAVPAIEGRPAGPGRALPETANLYRMPPDADTAPAEHPA